MTIAASSVDRWRGRVALAWFGSLLLLLGVGFPLLLVGTVIRDSTVWELPGAAVVFGLLGTVIATRRPGNPAGWLLLTAATGDVLACVLSTYGTHAYQHPGSLPLGRWVWAVGGAGWWVLPFVMLPLLILLFPDGRLPSPRWRVIEYALLAVAPLGVVVVALAQTRIDGEPGAPLNPIHALLPGTVTAAFALLTFVTVLVGTVSAVVSLIQRTRNATGVRRAQHRWLVLGSTTFAIFAAAAFAPGVPQNVVIVGFVVFVGCMTVAILRYRLYDLGRLVSRTLSYAALTALLAGCYLAGVTLATRVLPFSSGVGVAASTLAVAAAFRPARRRIQTLVDRRFNRSRYDAERIIDAFANRLRDQLDTQAVILELASAAARTMQPQSISIWTTRPPSPMVGR